MAESDKSTQGGKAALQTIPRGVAAVTDSSEATATSRTSRDRSLGSGGRSRPVSSGEGEALSQDPSFRGSSAKNGSYSESGDIMSTPPAPAVASSSTEDKDGADLLSEQAMQTDIDNPRLRDDRTYYPGRDASASGLKRRPLTRAGAKRRLPDDPESLFAALESGDFGDYCDGESDYDSDDLDSD
ncbi:hypothetical protein ABMA28_011231, partial [Loxostege sticticalis]